ncbi:MAG: DNA polymerase I [Rhodospirillales bacterium]|nr:DNA polymerase I [Rhodospirillales bacterium]MBO6788594.1 DNA polymerase I [Rhodospirillales bacterium]
MAEPDREHLFLIDGSGFIFRAYFAGMGNRRAQMTRSDGTPTNAAYIYTRMLLKLIDDTEADYVAVIFDKARKTFRNDIYPDYKAHRPDPPEDLIPQFALVREATEAMNVPAVQMENYEADDLIATYANEAAEKGMDVTIVSSDKDLMQLVNDRITLWDGMKDKSIGADEVVEKFGVGPDKVVEVQALAGDSTDNVPGVQGIGIKTAAELINQYGDLETLLARAEEIKQPKRREKLIEQADMARISKQLVTLKADVPIELTLNDFRKRQPDPEKLIAFLKEQEFKTLVSSISAKHGIAADAPEVLEEEKQAQDTDYTLVQKIDDLKPWIEAAAKAGIVAVDTETDALSSMQAGLVGVSISVTPGKACYVPLAHVGSGDQGAFDLGDGDTKADADAPEQIPMQQALDLLKPMLEDPGILKVGQNIKYDMQVLARYGISVAPVDDTMLLSYVLEGGLHGHGMDELALRFLEVETIKFKDVAGSGKNAVSFDKVPLDKAGPYAAEDADITLRLHRLMKPRLAREHMTTVYERLERPLIYVLEEMERTGIKVDAQKLKDFSADFEKRMAELEAHAHEQAGHEFNVGSPKQVGEILFDEMSLEGGKKGKTGAYSTSADVLEDLVIQGHELPQTILDWRQLQKLKSTYTDALVETINPNTGRVHTSFSQAVTSTGRLSSNDPNLQNIPIRSEEGRKIRQAFVADKGHVLMSADYSQIELRLLAHVADIDSLKEAFANGQDIHAITASEIFDVPVEGMDPMVRRQAKAINFGIIYGISGFGLARQLGIPRGDAQRYIEAYFERYPGIKDYMERTKKQAHDQGFVETPFGRKCHVRGINEKNQALRGNAERAAINAPIQGGAADIIKRAMVRVQQALDDAKLGARMLLQVHDELIFEVPEKEVEKTKSAVKDVMESAAVLNVPLEVDIGTGANWDEAH